MRELSILTILTIAISATAIWTFASDSFGATTNHEEGMTYAKSHSDIDLGQKVYSRVCAVCHDNGVAGAIKISDKATWRKHIHHGVDHMVESVINGKGAMPARGGDPNLSDDEIEAAVQFIIKETQ